MGLSEKGRCCLVCRGCGERVDIGGYFNGCASCARAGRRQPLELDYDYAALRKRDLLTTWRGRDASLWAFRELLPLPLDEPPVSLEEGGTPLIPLPGEGPGRLWVKDETRNPTAAHKDRFHAVSVSMARFLGYTRATSGTTGNHGASLAAYCAKAGLDCLIFCEPGAPEVLRQLAQLYGARVVVTRRRREHLAWLTNERGWYPSTGLTPMPVATPYGIEGYKTIAYEIYLQMGEHVPDRVLVPVAKGDILYGPWKGFQELRHLGADIASLPRMHAVQAAGCDPVVQGFRQKATEVPVHPNPQTIATSIGDDTAAPLSLTTLYDSGGTAEAVTDAQILEAMRRLARIGIAAEPAGAAAVAAALAMQEAGAFRPEEEVICVVTGGAVKWPETLPLALVPAELHDDDAQAVRAWIDTSKPA